MARIKRPSPDAVRELRRALHEDVAAGGLAVPETIRRMREAMGLSQARFGQVFGLTPRQVWELEAGVANPTLATLTRLGKPFGFQIGFVAAGRSFGSGRPVVGGSNVMAATSNVMAGPNVMAGLEPAIPSRTVRGEPVPHRLGWDGRVKPGHDG